MIYAITDLGNPVLLLPAALIVLLALLRAGDRGLARGWAICIVLSVAVIGAAKVGFGSWSTGFDGADIRSPSGHVALSCTFYFGIALLFGLGRPVGVKIAAWLAAAALVIVIALSRLVLGSHTPAEIALASLIGGGSLFALHGKTPFRAPPVRWSRLAAVFVLLMVVTHGHEVGIESQVQWLANRL